MWHIKVMCLICLAGDNILSFLTVMLFIQFLPSSHTHFSHVEVQTTPMWTCSLLTDTSAVRALALGRGEFPKDKGPIPIAFTRSEKLPCLILLGHFRGSSYPPFL